MNIILYKILSAGVLAYVGYIVLYTLNQKAIANLLKPIAIVYIASVLLVPLSQMSQNLKDAKQDINGLTNAINSVGYVTDKIKSYPETKENIPIIGTGVSQRPPSLTLREKLFPWGAKYFEYPVNGQITQGFNEHNHGLDIGADATTQIKSAREGEVQEIGNDKIYGNYILISHGSGWQTLYAHLSKVEVTKGQHVFTNTVLGIAGETGNARGIHLHFEIRKGNIAIDPLPWMKG